MARQRAAIATLVGLCSIIAACAPDASVEVRSASPGVDPALAVTPSPQAATPPTPESTSTTAPATSSTPPTAPTVPSAPTTATSEPDLADPTATTEPTTVPSTSPPDPGAAIVEPALLASIALADVVDTGDAKPVRNHDEFLAVSVADIERWWGEQFPNVYGIQFTPLQNGIYAGYPERSSAIPGCNEPETAYTDLQLYVAFYCNTSDFIAYDDGGDPDPLTGSLLTPLADRLGPAVVAVVMAHEFGHVVQDRVGTLDRPLPTIVTEQQADCFAGAWTGQAYRGESPLLRLGDADVRAGLSAMLEVRDPIGTNQFTQGGHGSAFDRVGAFQVGFTEGPARCAELIDDPLPLMPNVFWSYEDADRGGDAPYDCSDEPSPDCTPAPEFLAADIDNFWELNLGEAWGSFSVTAVPALDPTVCDEGVVLTGALIVCPAERAVIYDDTQVRELYAEVGDFALGYLYGIATAELVQRDVASGLTGEVRALVNDCLTGAWVRDITPDSRRRTPRNADLDGDGEVESTVTSSPGDLDEAIRMAILVGDLGASVDVSGSAFEKIEAFRTGVLNGLPACGIDLQG